MPSTLTHQLYCPRCKTPPLEVTHYEGSAWNPEKHGSHAELRALAGQDPHTTIPDATALDPKVADFSVAGPADLACPNCSKEMTALEIGKPVFSEIDQCEACGGIWLDHPEIHDLEALKQWSADHQHMTSELTWGNWWFQFFSQMPIEFNIKPRRFPLVTVCLIVLNVLLFLGQLILDESWWIELAAQGNEIVAGEDIWAVLTSMFLHGGWVHLFGNMYFLYILGDNVEDVLGRARYLLFYLVCGVVATVGFAIFNSASEVPLLGASGAIAGVMAAYLLLFRNSHLTFMFVFWQRKMPVWVWLGGWFVLNLIMSIVAFGDTGSMGGVAFIAHVAGFIAGLLIIWPLEKRLVRGHSLLRVMRLATA